MTNDRAAASFWLRGAAEIIAGLGQEPAPDVDIRRIEQVFGCPFPIDRDSPRARTVRTQLDSGEWIRASYSVAPYAGFGLSFSNAEGPTAPTSGIDASGFCQYLVADGYAKEPWYGEHGRWMGWSLTRERVRCDVPTRGASADQEYAISVWASWLPI